MCFIQDISLTRALFPQRLNKFSLHGNCARRYDILYASHVGGSESASKILRSPITFEPSGIFHIIFKIFERQFSIHEFQALYKVTLYIVLYRTILEA